MFALDLVWGIAVLTLWPEGGPGSARDTSALYSQPAYLVVGFVLGTMTTAVGGAVCARRSPALPYWNVAAFGVLSLAAGLLLSDATQPIWFTVFANLLTIPAAIIGGYRGLKQSRQKQA